VDIGAAFSWAWAKFKENAGPLVIVMLVALVGFLIAGIISGILRSAASGFFGILVVTAVGDVIFLLIGGVCQIGIYQSAVAVADGRPVEPAKMFTTDLLGPFVIALLLYGLMVGVGSLFCFIPGIVLAYLGFFTPFYVLDARMSPTDAIRASFQVTSKNVGGLIGFAVVAFLVYVLGFIACFVGVLVAGPVVLLATTYVFRSVNGRPVLT
jgi:uncharacterized membrane protein